MRNGSFATGEEALQALREAKDAGNPYDFAILDYQLPGMDGGALARAIKADPEIRGTVVVLLTSVSQWIEVRQKESGTVDASLVKPVRQSHLFNTLSTARARDRALSSRRGGSRGRRDAPRAIPSLRRCAGTGAGGRG
jgi:two-component system sensor histidine kinase/response regulator